MKKVIIILILVFLPFTVLATPFSDLVRLTNITREAAGVPLVRRSAILQLAAQRKATDMAEHGYFAHTSPAGITPWSWFRGAGYDFIFAGENLAEGFTTSLGVMSAWKKSPKHLAILTNPDYREIGVATAEGFYKGKKVVFIVQFFGYAQKEL